MNADKLVDFLFTGTAIVPVTLIFAGEAGMAIMMFVPLMVGACSMSKYLDELHDPALHHSP
jgi:hypothetical protein